MTDAENRGCHPAWSGWSRVIAVAALLAGACSAPPAEHRQAARDLLQGTAPAGSVKPPITFSWTGNSPGGVVRVSIEDRAQRPVFAFPARGSSAAAPQGLFGVLTRGEPFTWSVASVDDNGETSRASKPVEFTVE